MINSRIVHAVALGSVIARTASWFTEPTLADAQFDTLAACDEISDLTLFRFDLEVPLVASEEQINEMVHAATTTPMAQSTSWVADFLRRSNTC